MYVSEESHRGIVPMNHSNKDGTSSAESEEGRLRIKENTFSSDTHPTQSGTARVPRVGGCADKRYAWPRFIRDRTGCANERPSGSVRGAPGNWCPYRDRQASCTFGAPRDMKTAQARKSLICCAKVRHFHGSYPRGYPLLQVTVDSLAGGERTRTPTPKSKGPIGTIDWPSFIDSEVPRGRDCQFSFRPISAPIPNNPGSDCWSYEGSPLSQETVPSAHDLE